LNDACCRGVDNRGDAAGLGIEKIALAHDQKFGWTDKECVP
jgi:hypothetical protein